MIGLSQMYSGLVSEVEVKLEKVLVSTLCIEDVTESRCFPLKFSCLQVLLIVFNLI